MSKDTKKFELSFIDIILFLNKWRKPLIYVGVASIVLSSIISMPFIIKPKYKSEVIFYPTTNNSISNALMTELNQRQKDPLEFGEEEEAEKALQILQSSKLKDRLVRNFNLLNHYKIDTKSKYPMTDLGKKLDENIKYSRTRYLSVKIEVLDHDPVMAQKMAYGISRLYDSIKNEIQQEVAVPALEIVRRALETKEKEKQSLHNQMQLLGKEGITNYEEQSRALAEEIYKARAKGNAALVNDLLEQQKNLIQFGGQFTSLAERLVLEEEKLSDIKQRYDKAEIDVKERLKNMFIINDANLPEKKSYPVRWLIVLITFVCVEVLACIYILVSEQINKGKTMIKPDNSI